VAIPAGANPKAVQRMLGHASAAMTLDTYADLFEDDLDAVSERLNEVRKKAVVGFCGVCHPVGRKKPRNRWDYGALLLCARRDLNPRPIDP
jgi:hypothetical protein